MQKYQAYLQTIKKDYQKIAKLEFLNANGSVDFTLDNNPNNIRSKAFIQSGTLSCNLQNGRRRQVDIALANTTNDYDFSASKIWFGKQIKYSEGLILPSGEPYYITQGIFEIEEPSKVQNNNTNVITYRLVDKWSNIDGGLLGTLEDTYQILAGTNIFDAIASLLRLDKYDMSNNGNYPIDNTAPIFTNYYNGKTQTLTDGTVVSLLETPYDLTVEGGNSIATIILGLVDMLAGLVGYNANGRLQVDASQDDILDKDKPVVWEFHTSDKNFISVNTVDKTNEVYNDVIVVGATNDVNATARGRAQNRDASSPTCIERIGLKTKRISMPNYYSDDICEAYAEFMLKRYAVLNKSVTITCNQIFHIMENQVVSITDDKTGKTTRYLVQGFSRPVAQNGTMTINAISVSDFPIAKIVREN